MAREESALTPHANALQDVSGTLSIIVEGIMVVVNIFPIVVAFNRKKQRDRVVTDILIAALSITDIFSVVVPTPFGLISYFNNSWFGGKTTCVFYQLTMLWFQLVSVLLITYMCVDRLMALRMALYYRVYGTSVIERVKYFVLAIYVFALVIVTMPLMGLAPPAMSPSGKLCESWITSIPTDTKQGVFYVAVLSIGYCNFLVVILVNSSVTSLMMRLRRKLQPLANRRQTTVIQLQTDRKAIVEFTWMITAITILFYLTWFPTLLMLTIQKAGFNVSDIAVLYALLSTTLTGLLNPLIYGLFSKSYRRGYRHMLIDIFHFMCRCKKAEFHPIPAIASDRVPDSCIETSVGRPNEVKQGRITRSRSVQDRPFSCAFYNYGFQTSLYSALTDYQLPQTCNKSRNMSRNRIDYKRRTRSLSPPRSHICPGVDRSISMSRNDNNVSSSTVSNSSMTCNSSNFSDASLEFDDHDNVPSMQETRI